MATSACPRRQQTREFSPHPTTSAPRTPTSRFARRKFFPLAHVATLPPTISVLECRHTPTCRSSRNDTKRVAVQAAWQDRALPGSTHPSGRPPAGTPRRSKERFNGETVGLDVVEDDDLHDRAVAEGFRIADVDELYQLARGPSALERRLALVPLRESGQVLPRPRLGEILDGRTRPAGVRPSHRRAPPPERHRLEREALAWGYEHNSSQS